MAKLSQITPDWWTQQQQVSPGDIKRPPCLIKRSPVLCGSVEQPPLRNLTGLLDQNQNFLDGPGLCLLEHRVP